MKTLTDAEKLDKAVKFIKKIYNGDIPCRWIEDECGNDIQVVDTKALNELTDEAWHLLVDIDRF